MVKWSVPTSLGNILANDSAEACSDTLTRELNDRDQQQSAVASGGHDENDHPNLPRVDSSLADEIVGCGSGIDPPNVSTQDLVLGEDHENGQQNDTTSASTVSAPSTTASGHITMSHAANESNRRDSAVAEVGAQK